MSHIKDLEGLQEVKVEIELSGIFTTFAASLIHDTDWVEYDRNHPIIDGTVISIPEEYAIVVKDDEETCRKIFELDLGDIPLFIVPKEKSLVYKSRERKIMGKKMPNVRVYPLYHT